MKFLVVLSVALACVVAESPDFSAPIVRESFESSPEGNFNYAYETGNGIAAQVQGIIKDQKNEQPALEIQGGYKYTAPDGTPVEVSYVANENGYQPSGSAIPTPYPIPDYIQRSLDFIAAHPPQEVVAKAGKAAYSTLG